MTINEIKEKNLSCVVKVDSEEEAVQLAEIFEPNGYDTRWAYDYLTHFYDKRDGTVCFSISGENISGFDTKTYFNKNRVHGIIYNFKDLVRAESDFCTGFRGGKILTPSKPIPIEEHLGLPKNVSIHDLNPIEWYGHFTTVKDKDETLDIKEDNSMKMTFTTTEGYRVDKSNNGRIPTVTTHVTFINDKGIFRGTATCDKLEYSEREGVLNALANALCGSFDREYSKEVKRQARVDLHDRTCTTCHQVFDTAEEARAHEKWHIENKKARRQRYLERKEARDRLAEKEREERISKYMKELAK